MKYSTAIKKASKALEKGKTDEAYAWLAIANSIMQAKIQGIRS